MASKKQDSKSFRVSLKAKKARQIIRDLEENVYCRFKPSKLGGVGVFAIRDIPKGAEIFKMSKKTRFVGIDPRLVFDNDKIAPGVKEFVRDFCAVTDRKLYLTDSGLNSMDISFALNHSKDPNVVDRNKNGEDFFALKKIKEGEELTIGYHSYCDPDSFGSYIPDKKRK